MHLLSRTRPDIPAGSPERFVEPRLLNKQTEGAGFFDEMNRNTQIN
jgi:hypothetical protein